MKFKIQKDRLDFLLQEGIIFEKDGAMYTHIPHWYKIVDHDNNIVEYLSKYDILEVIEMEQREVCELAAKLVKDTYGIQNHEEFATAYNMAIITINHLLNKKL